MEKRSMLLTVLFVSWLVLFRQSAEAKSIDAYESYVDEEMNTTENPNADLENTTDIYENDHTNLVTEEETRLHPEDTFNTTSDDIIYLNVGGRIITTFRSTLTAVPHSKLALMFAKEKRNHTTTRKEKVYYFFDYNPVQFESLIDQLRVIKRIGPRPAYELTFTAPDVDVKFSFSDMLTELGLNAERFLSPLVGTHLNLQINTLIGWKQCYRGGYNVPFDINVLTNRCKGKRLLVACRAINDRKTLSVAGVGKREDLFRTCTPNSYCATVLSNNTGFYYAEDQAWGFEGRPEGFVTNLNQYHHGYYNSGGQGSFLLNPCDSSDQYSQYRLCWSLRSNVGRGGGDRCGSLKNLHNTKGWERVIYETV